jgi:hypothetical protein
MSLKTKQCRSFAQFTLIPQSRENGLGMTMLPDFLTPSNAAGLLVLSFVPSKKYAAVNAIEVVDESQ